MVHTGSTTLLVCAPFRCTGRSTAEGRRKERTHSRAARNCVASEIQTIHHDSFAFQVNSIEAAERGCDEPDMASCLPHVSVSWGGLKSKLAINIVAIGRNMIVYGWRARPAVSSLTLSLHTQYTTVDSAQSRIPPLTADFVRMTRLRLIRILVHVMRPHSDPTLSLRHL